MSSLGIKFCVFCGEKPNSKTKEHIIPKWLISLTGELNRKINIGYDYSSPINNGTSRMRQYAFSSFHFPACESCNSEFSSLESETKNIVEKILSKDFVTAIEIDILLDWFDKVRIGLWLGQLLLNNENPIVEPKFHIKSRIAEKDRCLFIYETDDDWKGILIIGTNYPVFAFSPSCFSLRINNFYFFNVSSDYLFSRNIGFPYSVTSTSYDDKKAIFQMAGGLNRLKLPLIKMNYLRPSIEIYQPIIGSKLLDFNLDDNAFKFYNNDYIKNNCLDYSVGKGSIFYMDGLNLLRLDSKSEISLSNGNMYESQKFLKNIGLQVLDFQLHKTKIPSFENRSISERKRIRDFYLFMFSMQKKIRKQIVEKY